MHNFSINNSDIISDINLAFENINNANNVNNFMFHHVEYRYMLLVENNISEKKQIYYDFLKDMEYLDIFLAAKNIDYIKAKDLINDIFEKYNIKNSKEYINYLEKSMLNSKAQKQIDNIKNDEQKKIIIKYFEKYLNKLKKNNNFTLENITKNKKNIKTFLILNFLLQSIVFELYSIGRILRYFKEQELYDDKKISILYSGNNHIYVFYEILILLGYKLIGKSKNIKERCISINDDVFKFNF